MPNTSPTRQRKSSRPTIHQPTQPSHHPQPQQKSNTNTPTHSPSNFQRRLRQPRRPRDLPQRQYLRRQKRHFLNKMFLWYATPSLPPKPKQRRPTNRPKFLPFHSKRRLRRLSRWRSNRRSRRRHILPTTHRQYPMSFPMQNRNEPLTQGLRQIHYHTKYK